MPRSEPGDHAVVQSGEPGDVGGHAAGRAVAEDEAGRLELPVQIPRRVAARRERLDLEARAVDRQRPPRLERLPLGSAIAFQHRQDRIPVRKRPLDARVAVYAQGRGRLAQEKQAGGVIDLRVRQQNARDRLRADAIDAPLIEGLELLTQVGRGVDEEPRPLAAADCERRLGARSRPDARARGLADLTMAVPLRRPSAGGRPENVNAHVAEESRTWPRQAPKATSGSGSYR